MKTKMRRLNLSQMQARCFATTPSFKSEPGFQVFSSATGVHLFKDNGASVLAVAHLDSVQSSNHFYELFVGGQRWVLNPKLDDRLGVYVILDYLPSYGLNYDILLTEGEESGRSTAGDFNPPEGKTYNWMFQFDRMGEDVVTYDYRCKELEEHLERHGFKTALGSFSDICKLESLGCKGFNVGCGYENYHSLWAIANLGILKRQLLRFLSFYWEMHNLHLPHTEKKWSGHVGAEMGGYGGYRAGWEGPRGGNHRKRGKHYRWDKDKKALIEFDSPEEPTQPPLSQEATQPVETVEAKEKKLSECDLCNQESTSLTYIMGCWFCDECVKEIEDPDGTGSRIGECHACLSPGEELKSYRGSWYCPVCLAWAVHVCEGKGDVVAPEN